MSVSCTRDAVRVVAEKLDVDAEAVSFFVSAHVDYIMRTVIQDAGKFMCHSKRLKLTTRDVDNALRLRGMSTLHGYGSADPMKFTYLRQNQGQTLFFLKEKDVDLGTLAARTDGFPQVPAKPTYSVHWLAIDGVQPAIGANPAPSSSSSDMKKRKDNELGAKKSKAVKHVLSKELQLYFDKVVDAVVQNSLKPRNAESVFLSLSVDPGLQPILPYLAKFVSEQVMDDLRNLNTLYAVMRMTRCVLVNPHLKTELYLHQLMPPILTCLVSRRLCHSPMQDHWALRDLAASLIKLICTVYAETYADLQPRITMTLCSALQQRKKPMTTQYGTIVGLAALGPLTVQSHLLPHILPLLKRFNKALTSKNPEKRMEATRCIGAMQFAFGTLFAHANLELLDQNKSLVIEILEVLGESVIPWSPSSMVIDTFI